MGLVGDDVSKITLGDQVLYDRDNQWKTLTGLSEFFIGYTMLYRIHRDEKFIEAVIGGKMPQSLTGTPVFIDLSALVVNVTKCSFGVVSRRAVQSVYTAGNAGAKLFTDANNLNSFGGGYTASSVGQDNTPFVKIYYDELV